MGVDRDGCPALRDASRALLVGTRQRLVVGLEDACEHDRPVVHDVDLDAVGNQAGVTADGLAVLSDCPEGRRYVAHDVPVLAFTVNDEATMARLVERGIRGIETDDPALLVGVLKRLGVR